MKHLVVTAACVLAATASIPAASGSAYALYFREPMVRPIPFDPWGRPQSAAIGQVVGGDRRSDVLPTAWGSLHVFRQRSDGTLDRGRAIELPTAYAQGAGIAVGDLDGDARHDVAVAVNEGIVILYQRGSGLADPIRITLDPPDSYYTAYNVHDVKIADFDRDGRRDMAIMTGVAGLGVLWNRGGGRFALADVDSRGGFDFAVGDVTGDDRPDIVAAAGISPPGVVRVFRTTAQRTFAGTEYPVFMPDPACGAMWAVTVGDVTGDRRADVVGTTGGCSEVINVFAQRPDGALDVPAWYPLGAQAGEAVRIKDMDGDDRKDVVVAHGSDAYRPVSHFGVYLQRADSTLSPEVMFDLPDTSHYRRTGLAVGSVNGDPLPDVVVASHNHGVVYRLQR